MNALVTGANSGIGYHCALELAQKGAFVLLGCRSADKAKEALQKIKTAVPDSRVEWLKLDLSSLDSVKDAADSVLARKIPINLLINNAGIMAPLTRTINPAGHEIQFATNHLGHFALTMRLLPAFKDARVVTVNSIAHKRGRMRFKDLMGEQSYNPILIYAQSKLANLLFAFELERRARRNGWDLTSIAAHPGVAQTQIIVNGLGKGKKTLLTRIAAFVSAPFSQSEDQGAFPVLFAAVSPEAVPGAAYGPDGWGERTGLPTQVNPSPAALNEADAARLWEISLSLTKLV